MCKLFKLLTLLAIISSGASQVSACGFKDTDLSTWGSAQFQQISQAYLAFANNNGYSKKTWSFWIAEANQAPSLEATAINRGLSLVVSSRVPLWYFLNTDPSPQTSLSSLQVLAKGVHYYLIADTKKDPFFKGKCNFIIKGNI